MAQVRHIRATSSSGPAKASVYDLFTHRMADLEERVAEELQRTETEGGALGEIAVDAAREIYRGGLGLISAVSGPGGFTGALAEALAPRSCDQFGVDQVWATTLAEILKPVARLTLGIETDGDHVLAPRGGTLVTLNRSAWPVPVEALILWAWLSQGHGGGRPVYALWEGASELGSAWDEICARVGIFRASTRNAAALLEDGAVVLTFPEGRAARRKTYDRRYRLARFDDACVLRGAREVGARIVPAAVVGSEESYPVFGFLRGYPVTPAMVLGGPLGMLPLPLRWRIRFGAPMEYPPLTEDGDDGVGEAVRARMQALLAQLLAERRSIVSG